MREEVHGLPAFYATPAGRVAARLLRTRLAGMWPAAPGERVLGLGWPQPYLDLWRDGAACCVAAVPTQLGAMPQTRSATLVEEMHLPFADRSFDRVLLVHGLEAADHARKMLRDVWRVLAEDGRLIVVVPNRRGMWAHLEHTPFGHGQPYSAGQLSRLLDRHLFQVERRDTALFIPPFGWQPLLRGARIWEATGRAIAPRYAGVAIVEARKAVWGALPTGATVPRRVVMEAGGVSQRLP
ncbi:class I SAM-dependent methyltransferase [Humitalea sp. 24SJ18S-53]|uniref:class I SAM-dependent methyltransferase n=1 Tax=Humitalea sp. 24SJ18S-53 TaxID=3422307 RepID=UPI003D678422